MFNWKFFWNYYNSATNNRNQSSVNTMQKGFDNAWNMYWQKNNGASCYLFLKDVLSDSRINEFCKLAKTQMMSLGLSSAMADSVIKQLKKYCKDIM